MNHPYVKDVTSRFSSSTVIVVNSYRDVFFRKPQDFNIQKRSKCLILAIKKTSFLYKGSPFAQSSGSSNFFYNTLSMNCLYDCSYCYLQGMYPSAHIVCFLNIEDYFSDTIKAINNRHDQSQPLFLSLSYDTDILAFEKIFPYCRHWINFAHNHENFIGEIRTKSTNFSALSDLYPTTRILFAWTLSPSQIAKKYEFDAPSPQSRLNSALTAVQRGWRIRLSFDPVILENGWKLLYEKCVHEAFDLLPLDSIYDATVGPFRMSSDHLRKARKSRPQYPILQRDWHVVDGVASLPPDQLEEVSSFMFELLSKRLPSERISMWSCQ
jgi:spore photoproduct lyase